MNKTTKEQLPKGWFIAGSNTEDYEYTIDTKNSYKDKNVVLLSARKENPVGFGTLMQDFSAGGYREKRMALTAIIRSESLKNWAGMWMRVEGAGGDVLGFDNMKNRAITGTTDWKEYQVVLDVPKESRLIGFGLLLSGQGKVWIADVRFEAVDTHVATTNMEKPLPTKPVNLDFTE